MGRMTNEQSFDPLWNVIESHLLGLQRAAMLELRNYPPPIASCDAQIPVLWEKADEVATELDRLAAAGAIGSAGKPNVHFWVSVYRCRSQKM